MLPLLYLFLATNFFQLWYVFLKYNRVINGFAACFGFFKRVLKVVLLALKLLFFSLVIAYFIFLSVLVSASDKNIFLLYLVLLSLETLGNYILLRVKYSSC